MSSGVPLPCSRISNSGDCRPWVLGLFMLLVVTAPAAGQGAAPDTRWKERLPEPPDKIAWTPSWRLTDLSSVPELFLQKPALPRAFPKDFASMDERKKQDFFRKHRADLEGEVGDLIHNVRVLNDSGLDQFIRLLIAERLDLAGLPFILDEDSRMRKDQQRLFLVEVTQLRRMLATVAAKPTPEKAMAFWKKVADSNAHPAHFAALMQMITPEQKDLGVGLVERLALFGHAEATAALARLALHSPEKDVRDLAIHTLKSRPHEAYTDILLGGLSYPWPSVAENAAAAITALERRDLLPQLVRVLDEPDPRAPALQKVDGRDVAVVREVVRLNHHRNCLLCHAPTEGKGRMERDVLVGPVPSTGLPLTLTPEYYAERSGNVVRADVTYLRQDFSLMLDVAKAEPWPARQRFDFLVRTKRLSAEEVEDYGKWRVAQPADYVAPNHRAVVTTLRRLTGVDAAPKGQAWRNVLGI